ncbi:MAG: hypothetical protein OHK0013_18090 [Sandaracinaceae bacterium]
MDRLARIGAPFMWLLFAAFGSFGCRCEDPRPPPATAPSEPTPAPREHAASAEPAAESDETSVETSVEAMTESAAEPASDGVEIPVTLVRQLAHVQARGSRRDRGPVTAAACARGCALVSPDGALVLVRVSLEQKDARGPERLIPDRLTIVRLAGDARSEREVDLDGIPEEALVAYQERGGEAPWTPRLARALGDLSDHRWAEDLVAARAESIFSRSEYAPLVALGGAFDGRWLFAEIGETAYRLHLLRADRSVDRLLATLPLRPTACEGDLTDLACVAPMAIDAVYASRDGRFLYVWVGYAAAGSDAPSSEILTLALDDASALDPRITPASRRAELERSLRAAGPALRLWPDDFAPIAEDGPNCARSCALFFENGSPWIVRPSTVSRGVPARYFVYRADGTSAEILGTEEDPEPAIARALEGGPTGLPRRLVQRRANASFHRTLRAPLVELRAPHAGVRLSASLEGEAYVIAWEGPRARGEVGRVPALTLGGRPSPPGILEAFAPPTLGYPVVIVGYAVTRPSIHPDGIEHTLFHVVVEGPPGDANAAAARRTGASE